MLEAAERAVPTLDVGWLDGAQCLFAHTVTDAFGVVGEWSIQLDIAYQAT